MRITTKSVTIVTLSACLAVAAIAQKQSDRKEEPRPKNLTVLSKNISHDSLINIMKEYSVSLGVRCGFCHAKSSDGEHLNFASDDNGKKKVARYMMTMTAAINKKYFAAENKGNAVNMVSCYTCHHGHEEPEAFVMPKEEGR